MAVGGALRAALRAGRFSAAGRESRRQARALADMNRRGGIGGGPAELASALEQRGFERYAGTGFGATPRGNMVTVDPMTGARTVFPQTLDDFSAGVPMARGPIESPVEGVRVWNDPFFGGAFGNQSIDAPPPWMGRGVSPPARGFDVYFEGGELPIYGRPPVQYVDAFDSATMFTPYGNSVNTNLPNSNFMNMNVPRAFGGSSAGPNWAANAFFDPRPGYLGAPWFPASRNAAPRPPRFFFDDFA